MEMNTGAIAEASTSGTGESRFTPRLGRTDAALWERFQGGGAARDHPADVVRPAEQVRVVGGGVFEEGGGGGLNWLERFSNRDFGKPESVGAVLEPRLRVCKNARVLTKNQSRFENRSYVSTAS